MHVLFRDRLVERPQPYINLCEFWVQPSDFFKDLSSWLQHRGGGIASTTDWLTISQPMWIRGTTKWFYKDLSSWLQHRVGGIASTTDWLTISQPIWIRGTTKWFYKDLSSWLQHRVGGIASTTDWLTSRSKVRKVHTSLLKQEHRKEPHTGAHWRTTSLKVHGSFGLVKAGATEAAKVQACCSCWLAREHASVETVLARPSQLVEQGVHFLSIAKRAYRS